MTRKKKILFNIPGQLGSHTDTFMYCKYLDKEKYEVHYIGFDEKRKRKDLLEVNVHYIPIYANKIQRYWVYLKAINKLIREENFDLVFQVDHKFTLPVRLCNLKRKFILDIRTGDLSNSGIKRLYFNLYILFTSLFYTRVTIISESLRSALHIPRRKSIIIPLGGETRNCRNKTWDYLHLFYIGTFTKRNIHETVEGLAYFIKRNSHIKVTYDIIGTGKHPELQLLKKTIQVNKLEKIVLSHGYKVHEEIADIWENANLGIVYIPMKTYYDYQPTTKLFEYLLSGMPVIATNTFENRQIVNSENGILIEDNPASFAHGLEQFFKQRENYDSDEVKRSQLKFNWKNIVADKLEPLLDKILE